MQNVIERTDIMWYELSLFSFLQPFNESVNICHTPIVRKCGDDPVGPDICSTHYETNCETKYKTYEVEQDEPECRMELMRKCKDVTSKISFSSTKNMTDLLTASSYHKSNFRFTKNKYILSPSFANH